MDPRQDPAASRPDAAAPAWHHVEPGSHRPRPVRLERATVVMLCGIALAVILGLVVGARLGTFTVALSLAVAGTWRAATSRGPAGLVVRSRSFDVVTCWAAAVVIAVLAITAPGVG